MHLFFSGLILYKLLFFYLFISVDTVLENIASNFRKILANIHKS